MVRAIVGTAATLGCFRFDHSLGMAAAAATGVWVLAGIGHVITAAARRPIEPAAQVANAAVTPPAVGSPDVVASADIECPRCSQFVFPPATTCSCGWDSLAVRE
jgi:hypothetical protein